MSLSRANAPTSWRRTSASAAAPSTPSGVTASLHKALATGTDPLHLAHIFNIDHTNVTAYANAAQPCQRPSRTGGDPQRVAGVVIEPGQDLGISPVRERIVSEVR